MSYHDWLEIRRSRRAWRREQNRRRELPFDIARAAVIIVAKGMALAVIGYTAIFACALACAL